MGSLTHNSSLNEMAIVDLFTKLIFGGDHALDASELQILQALRQVDRGLGLESLREVGFYLRALGVSQMIELVTRVQQQLGAAPVYQATASSVSPAQRSSRHG